STNNTRIERLWVEVGSDFARAWRAFFYRLEDQHQLERKDPKHLWLLHHLFLDLINDDCITFQRKWNRKPISGEGHDQSPRDMLLLGGVQHGIYRDDFEAEHPAVLEQFLGADGPDLPGNGQLSDDDYTDEVAEDSVDSDESEFEYDEGADENDDRVANAIEEAYGQNFHPEPVAVPKHECPFDDEEQLQIFVDALTQATNMNLVPRGYGIRQEEWEDDEYPSYGIIKSGRRGSKRTRISLPDHIWRPRAELWTRALDILQQIQYMYED
ncbi:hypothetical protein C8F01DRAFT_976418, partial [Mycena amicta]